MSEKKTYFSQFEGWANLTEEQKKLIFGERRPQLRYFDEERIREMMADFVFEVSQYKDKNHYSNKGYRSLKEDVAKWFEENV